MRAFTQTARLKAIVSSQTLPAPMAGFYSIIEPLLSSKYRGSLDTDINALAQGEWRLLPRPVEKEVALTVHEECLLRANGMENLAIQHQDCAEMGGRGGRFIPLAERDKSRWGRGGNSLIFYTDGNGFKKAGMISKIIRLLRCETESFTQRDDAAVLVLPYETLSPEDATSDPYRQWPELDCWLVYNTFQPQLDIIRPHQIHSHMARCYYEEPVPGGRTKIVVLSLDRVRA